MARGERNYWTSQIFFADSWYCDTRYRHMLNSLCEQKYSILFNFCTTLGASYPKLQMRFIYDIPFVYKRLHAFVVVNALQRY